MDSKYKNKLLRFIAGNLLNLTPMRLTAKECRRNRQGTRSAIVAEDSGGIRYSLTLSVIHPHEAHPIIWVDLQVVGWPHRSNVMPEHFNFKLTEKSLLHGMVMPHRLIKYLPVNLPLELCRDHGKAIDD